MPNAAKAEPRVKKVYAASSSPLQPEIPAMAGFLAGRDAKRAVVWVCCLLKPEKKEVVGRNHKAEIFII